MYDNKIGLVDVGSNSIRLVVFGIDERFDMHEVINIKTPARLSQYLVEDKVGQVTMNETGIEKLVEVLVSFTDTAQRHNVKDYFVFATAAVRQSFNQAEILQKVKDATGIEMEILSEKEEASFGQYAIAHTMSVRDYVTIDIGGGSCEITLVQDKKIQHYHSFPFGVVTLNNQFFQGKDHNDSEAIDATCKYVCKEFKKLDWLKKARLPIVAVGGSARNVALVHQRLQRYPIAGLHGYRLSQTNLETTLNLFKATPYDEMENIDGLSSDRTDLIIPANIVFMQLYKTVKTPTFYISNQGLREGYVMHYINKAFKQPIASDLVRTRAVQKLVNDFKVSPRAAQIRTNIVLNLYRQLSDLGLYDFSFEQHLEIEFASYLYQCGGFIDLEAESQHTFYLVSNMNLSGFSHKNRVRLALLASYRNKSLLYQYTESFVDWFSNEEITDLYKYGGLIKFSEALNDSQTEPISQLDLHLCENGKDYCLSVYHTGPIVAESYRANRHLKHLSRSLDSKLSLEFIQVDSFPSPVL